MTASFPLSISDHPDADKMTSSQIEVLPLEDLQDGFVRLRRRDESRLWFRMTDPAAPVHMRRPAPALVPTSPAKSTENRGTDKLVSEMVRVVQAGRPSLIDVIEAARGQEPGSTAPVDLPAPAVVKPKTSVASTEILASNEVAASSVITASSDVTESGETIAWRAVQAGAPVLLLSAGPVLESSKPGPILGPGMRYRIIGMTGSVVAMEVMHANGDRRSGYANAVDLRCIEPKIHTSEFQTQKGVTSRLRLTRLATTTFGLFGG